MKLKILLLWDQEARNDRTIANNKPDIIIRDNKKGTGVLIGVAITGEGNVIEKKAEKILNYEDRTTELQRLWYLKGNVKPVLSGATETISKSLRKYLSNIPVQHEFKGMQKHPYCSLHTYCGKCQYKITNHISREK